MNKQLKIILMSTIPSLLLGCGFYLLIGLLYGMDGIKDTSPAWIAVGFLIFTSLFALRGNDQNIFGRFLKYAAYECWLSPLFIIIYTISSMSQANETLGTAGATGAGIGGFILIFVFGIGGGLLGVVLYLTGSSLQKSSAENREKQKLESDRIIIKPSLMYFGAIFIVLVSLAYMGKNVTIFQPKNDSPIKGYNLTEKENIILDTVLLAYANFFAYGDPKFLDQSLPVASASQVAATYNENQVAADQQYNDKLLFLTGQIQGINSGLGNEPYILLYGINPFLSPQAHFKDGNTPKIASLKKNQKIYLVCIGNGAIIGTPMFKNCEFADDYALKKRDEMKTAVQEFLHGTKAKSKNVVSVTLMSITRGRDLPHNSICFVNRNLEKCLNEIITFDKQAILEKRNALSDELHALGVQISRNPISNNIAQPKPTTAQSKPTTAQSKPLAIECAHKHKQQEMRLTSVYLNGIYTEIPQGIVCKEVCDTPGNKNYAPCD